MRRLLILVSLQMSMFFTSTAVFADYPAVIDLANNPGVPATRILGKYPTSYLGHDLAYGDFNNDGFSDIITGAFKGSPDERDNAGVAYIIWGGATLHETDTIDLATPNDHMLVFQGIETGEQLGIAVAAGDINGDGYDDAIMGAWHKDGPGKFDCGAVYVYFGSSSLNETMTVDLHQPQDDLVTIYGPDAGYVIFDDNPYYADIDSGSELGNSVDSGDINGDGYDDILLGTWAKISTNNSELSMNFVIMGSPTFKDNTVIDLADDDTASLTFTGKPSYIGYSGRLGYESTVGDINNDGYDDVIMSDVFADFQTHQDCGEIYVYWGNATAGNKNSFDLNQNNPEITVIHGSGHAEYAGMRLSTGDIDGDGYQDILADAYSAHRGLSNDDNWYGKAYIVFGGPELRAKTEVSVTDTQHVLSIWGEAIGGSFGKPSAGDINGDGIQDILVQADRQNNDTGKAFIIWGSPELRTIGTIDLKYPFNPKTEILGEYPNGKFGFLSISTDLNGDSYDDMIFSAQTASPLNRSVAGSIHIVWGMPHDQGAINYYHFYVADTSGPTATVVIPSDIHITGVDTQDDIELGIFTYSGVCAGKGTWNGQELSITTYGDTGDNSYISGFLPGELYRLRAWIPSIGEEYQANMMYSSGPAYFSESSTSVITTIVLSAPGPATHVSSNLPETISLINQNYPNPFNPRTTIPFVVGKDGIISLTVYNILGEKVAELAEGEFTAGSHQVTWDASDCASGIYICRLVTTDGIQTKRMMLLK